MLGAEGGGNMAAMFELIPRPQKIQISQKPTKNDHKIKVKSSQVKLKSNQVNSQAGSTCTSVSHVLHDSP